MNSDLLIPSQLRLAGVESRRRARLLIYAILIANLTAVLASGMVWYAGHHGTAFAILFTLIFHSLVYALLWQSKSTALAAHTFMCVVFLEITFDFGPDGGYGVLAIIALPLAAAVLLNTRAAIAWTLIGALWAGYLGPIIFRAGDFSLLLGMASAIMTIVVGIAAIIIETIRAKAVEESEASQRLLESRRDSILRFAESAFPAIAVASQGEVEYASEGAYAALGYSKEDFAFQQLIDFFHPDDFPMLLAKLTKPLASGFRTEARLRHKDGQWVWLEIYGIPQEENAGSHRWIFAARDIQDQRMTSSRLLQAQRLEGIGVLAAGIAHDFNNLLTVIMGRADLLPESDGRQQILQAARQAAELTSSLLEFGRKVPAHAQATDMVRVVKKLEPMFRSLLGPRIPLAIDVPDDPVYTRMAAGQLDQALLNLVTNAKEAMAEGGNLHISVTDARLNALLAESLDVAPGAYLCLIVRDSGKGMTSNTLQHAFDPFYSTKPQPIGSGLGLSSVYGIVREAGGAIELESTVGLGTQVRIYLPASEEGSNSAAIEDVLESDPSFKGAHILLVEDDLRVREVLTRSLTNYGFEIEQAGLADQALTMARKRLPDMVITDVVMPGMDGIEFVTQLRALDPDLPVLLVSGYTSPQVREWTRTNSPHARFLAKPFRTTELLAQVSALLAGRDSR